MPFTAKLDEYGKGAWIALMVLAFAVYWPAGLAVLAFLAASGRMRSWKMDRPGRWHNAPTGRCGWGRSSSSGNRAFDDYRAETLKRLEEEQREFMEYLERLRQAKDKSEFDQFMADRRGRQVPDAPQTSST